MADRFERPDVQELCCTPPTFQPTIEDLQASVTHGGFFDNPNILHDKVLNDPKPRVPVNPDTGLAYPLILPPKRYSDHWTRHHHNFPEAYLEGRGLRHVYVQRVYARLHNSGPLALHKQFSIPAELPQTPQDEFGTFVMGLARDLPHQGLDLFSGEPKIRCMTWREERRLREPGVWNLTSLQRDLTEVPELHMKWRSEARRRLPMDGEVNQAYEYAAGLILSAVKYIDEYERQRKIFASTTHPKVGLGMLREASRILVATAYFRGESLSEKYGRSWHDGRLRPDAPRECSDLVVSILGNKGILGRVLQDLRDVVRDEATSSVSTVTAVA